MKFAGIAGGTKDLAVGLAILVVTAGVVYVGWKVYRTGKKVGEVIGGSISAVKNTAANIGGAVQAIADKPISSSSRIIPAGTPAGIAVRIGGAVGDFFTPPPANLPPARRDTNGAPAEVAPWWWGGGSISTSAIGKNTGVVGPPKPSYSLTRKILNPDGTVTTVY